MAVYSVCRTPLTSGEAEVHWEETSKSTREARRGMDPSTYTKIKEITSGMAYFQQGYATTCKDS